MATNEQQLVLNMLGSFAVQVFEILVEALPLSACAVRLLIRFIGLIDQAEIVCSLGMVRNINYMQFEGFLRSQKCWERSCQDLAGSNHRHWCN